MPIYEYQCPHCGARLELEGKNSEIIDYTRCKDCGNYARRIFSPFIHIWKCDKPS